LLLAVTAAVLVGPGRGLDQSAPLPATPIRMGLTFSQRQADYLTLPWNDVYGAALDLSPTVLRLGAYWDQIERKPGHFDFTTLDAQLTRAHQHGLSVVLTVGMKAPRYPEFFVPGWLDQHLAPDQHDLSTDPVLRTRTLVFIERVVRHVRDRDGLIAWQVENEPLDASGPHYWWIGQEFLAEEVRLVRQLDRRPIVVTMFLGVNPLMLVPRQRLTLEARAQALLGLGDVLGLDLYPSRAFHSFGRDWYFRWPTWIWDSTAATLRQLALDRGKHVWVMEAQAEPWEPTRIVYTDRSPSRSMQPPLAIAAIKRLEAIGFDTILLWGVEHWYMRRERLGDAGWWDAMSTFFPGMPRQTAHAPAAGASPPARS
jgi:hypothetical protein